MKMTEMSASFTTTEANNISRNIHIDDLDTSQMPFKTAYFRILDFISAISVPILVFGMTGNILNIIVYAKTGVRDNVAVSFLALSMSDLMYLIIITLHVVPNMLQHFVEYRQNRPMNWIMDPKVLIYPFYWYALTFYETSILITVYISVVRCACVAIPFKVKSAFTARRAVIAVVVIFISIFLLRLPMFMTRRIFLEFDPDLNKTQVVYKTLDDGGLAGKLNDIVNRNIMNWVSMVTVVACLVVMITKLRASARFRSGATAARPTPKAPAQSDKGNNPTPSMGNGNQPTLSTREAQVVRSVVLVAAVFVTCQTPQMAYTLARRLVSFNGNIDGWFYNTYYFAFASRASTVLAMINASVNICVYYNFNSRYRQTMRILFKMKS